MRLLSYLSCVYLLSGSVPAQNLVPNPSFEDYYTCPHTLDQITEAENWSTFRGTCDYFNACDADTTSVPWNWFGYQSAATGSAYAGIYCFSEDDGNPFAAREWFGCELISPLVPGTRYYVTLKACLTTGGFGTNGSFIYASDRVGVRLSTTTFFQGDLEPVPNQADVYAPNIITDSTDWTLVSGSFVADSVYTHMVVGNFFDDATTDAVEFIPGGLYQYAYYYIDDICLSADSATCPGAMGMANVDRTGPFIYPNPFTDEVNIAPGPNESIEELNVVDLFGRAVPYSISLAPHHALIRFEPSLAAGTYLITAVFTDGRNRSQVLHHSVP